MLAPMRHKTTRKMLPRRRVVNLHSLQMMVRSGVVRRADSLPPLPLSRTRLQSIDDPQRAVPKEAASEQGWLSRIILGRKSQSSILKRS